MIPDGPDAHARPRAAALAALALFVGLGLLVGAAFDGLARGRPGIVAVDAAAGLAALAIAASTRRLVPRYGSDRPMVAVTLLAIVPNVVSVVTPHAAGTGPVVIPFYLALVPLGLGALLASRATYAVVAAAAALASAVEAVVLQDFNPLYAGVLVLSIGGGWMIQGVLRASALARAEAASATARAEQLATVGTLVASLSHEINNPLMIVGGHAEVARGDVATLLDDPALTAHQREALERVATSLSRVEGGAARVAGAVRALHVLSDTQSLRDVPDVHALLADSLLLAQMRVPARIDVELERGPPTPARVDPRDLFQILLALLTDAADACVRGGGRIRLSASAMPPDVLVVVEDTAPAPAPTGRPDPALSLGRAADTARRAGGELRIEPLAPGGTRRVLRIPGGRESPR